MSVESSSPNPYSVVDRVFPLGEGVEIDSGPTMRQVIRANDILDRALYFRAAIGRLYDPVSDIDVLITGSARGLVIYDVDGTPLAR